MISAARPLVIAHRGASWDAPENTVAAFERAIADGADYVEFDVRATHDGHLVVSHDPVRRTLAALRERRPDVATLPEVLAACAGQVGLALEIKQSRLTERTLAALDEHEIRPDSVIVVSFRPNAILATRRLRPALRTIQHVARVPIRRAAEYAWGVGFDYRAATARRIALARSLGLATAVYTVNDPERMRELCALAVTAIFTDRPDALRRIADRS